MKPLFSLLFFLLATLAMAQTPKKIYRQFKKCDGATSVFIPRFLLHVAGSMAVKGAEDDEDKRVARLLKKVNTVRVLQMEDCKPADIKAFQEAVQKMNQKGYETLVSSKQDDENALVLLKMKKDRIRELVIFNTADADAALVMLRCNISPEHVRELVDEVQKERKSK